MTTQTDVLVQIKSSLGNLNDASIIELKAHIDSLVPKIYTASEVSGALHAADLLEDGWDELAWQIRFNRDHKNEVTTIELRGEQVSIELVDENEDDDYAYDTFVVIKVGDQFFKKTGHYQSHYGNDWDGPFKEVTPTEKSVVVYE